MDQGQEQQQQEQPQEQQQQQQQQQIVMRPDAMPARGHATAPRFAPDQLRELRRYFQDLDLLFVRAQIVRNEEKKMYARHYVDVDTAELWAAIPEHLQPHTWLEFKNAVIALYPGASEDRKWTLADLDRIIGEQLRLGIHSASELAQYYRTFYMVTTYLRTRHRLSEREQASAFIRGFQEDLWKKVSRRLELILPDHDLDDVYPFAGVYAAAKYVLHSTNPTFLNLHAPAPASATAISPNLPVIPPGITTIKTEDLSTLFESFASTLIKSLQPAQTIVQTATQPAQVRRPNNPDRDTTHCNFCGEIGHFIGSCQHVTAYMTQGKIICNIEGKVVLPSGAYCPRTMPGRWLRERIDEWHQRNPGQTASPEFTRGLSQQLVYEIQDESAEQRIAALEKEIFALRNKEVFDGVEVPRRKVGPPARKPADAQQVQAPAAAHAQVPEILKRPSKPNAPAPKHASVPANNSKQEKATGELDKPEGPLHPFRNVREAAYAPPHEKNFAAQPPRLGKDNNAMYRSVAPIQDPKVAQEVYKRSMDVPCITLSQKELLSISPEVRQHVREAVTPKRIVPTGTREVKKVTIEEIPDEDDPLPFAEAQTKEEEDEEEGYVVPDPYETFLSTHGPGERPNSITVAKESHALRAIHMLVMNTDYVECIIDPGSQVIAMSEAVCHNLGISYDPDITLKMQSANGEIDRTLGLARNVPCHIGKITLYLQIHVIRSPAYDILLGRPFDVLTESIVKNYSNEDQTITIRDPNTSKCATIPTIPRGKPHHQLPPTSSAQGDFRLMRD